MIYKAPTSIKNQGAYTAVEFHSAWWDTLSKVTILVR